jgi:hypothetical protein
MRVIVATVLFLSIGLAQNIEQKPLVPAYRLRFIATNFQQNQNLRYCILIGTEGKFHVEKSIQDWGSKMASTQVSEGQLEQADFAKLSEALDEQGFVAFTSTTPSSFIAAAGKESWTLSVFRGDHYQKLILIPDSTDAFKKKATSFQEWLKLFRKRRLPGVNMKPTSCKTPEMIAEEAQRP